MPTRPNLSALVRSEAYTSEDWNRRSDLQQLLPAEAYTSQQWYQREQRQLFGRTWNFAGMAEDVKAPGDYKCIECGDAALVLIRTPEGGLRAFHNVCRHRGARLLEGSGHLPGGSLTCFYHKWTYSLSGDLIGVPHQQALFPNLDKSCYGLRPAKVGVWKNLVFVHPDPDAAPFEEWLGDIDAMLGPFEAGQTGIHDPEGLVEVSDVVYRVRANWKTITENFIDGYHLPLLHAASLGAGDFTAQRWQPFGAHSAFYRPIKPGLDQEKSYLGFYGDQPWPTIEGVPERYGASYQWLFPNLGLFQTATSWSTFHVIPLAPALSLVQSRVRAVPVAQMPEEESVARDALPEFIVSAKGRCLTSAERKPIGPDVHHMVSGDVMREDIYACEAVQAGMNSPAFSPGPLSKWEMPMSFFQRQILDAVPVGSNAGSPLATQEADKRI